MSNKKYSNEDLAKALEDMIHVALFLDGHVSHLSLSVVKFKFSDNMDTEIETLYPQYPRAQVMPKDNVATNQAAPPVLGPPHVTQSMLLLGPENTVTICPHCLASIRTAVKYTVTTRTHIAAALWCILCCMCCIPYGSESAKNSDHYCPNCQRYLGTYIR